MYDFQKTVLISTKPTMGNMVLRYVSLVLAALALAGCLLNPYLFLIPAILLIVWWWRMWFHSGVEYEYAYFDGDLDFDKIKDKRKRKRIISVNMEQVEQIAPVGDRSLYNLHQNSQAKMMDFSSRKSDRKCYELVWKNAEQTVCIRFEPDEQFVDSICVKYGRKVIR